MVSKICVFMIFAMMVLTKTGEAFNAGREDTTGEQFLQITEALMDNSELNAWFDRLTPNFEDAAGTEWLEFLADYKSLTAFSLNLGEVVVKEINEGSSDDLLWTKFDQLQIEAQSVEYYQRLAKLLGESKLEEYFTLVKDAFKGLAVQVRETLA